MVRTRGADGKTGMALILMTKIRKRRTVAIDGKGTVNLVGFGPSMCAGA